MIKMFDLVTIRGDNGIRIVDVNCDLDSYTAVQLRKELESLVHQKIYKLVVNLSNIEHINSTSVGALVSLSKQVRQKKGNLKVCGLTGSLQSTFDLVPASKALEAYSSEVDAMASF